MVFHEKIIEEDLSIIEMKIWQIPASWDNKPGVRYSLFYVKGKKILVGYDNHYPKGPHRHYQNTEEPYHFTDINKLLEDFKRDVLKIKHENKENKN